MKDLRIETPEICGNCRAVIPCYEGIPCAYSWADFADEPDDKTRIINGVKEAIIAGDAWLTYQKQSAGKLIVRAAGRLDAIPRFVDKRLNDDPNPCVHLNRGCKFTLAERPYGGAVFRAKPNGTCSFPDSIQERHIIRQMLSWEAYQDDLYDLALKDLPSLEYEDYSEALQRRTEAAWGINLNI
jgi:hypothetical protein